MLDHFYIRLLGEYAYRMQSTIYKTRRLEKIDYLRFAGLTSFVHLMHFRTKYICNTIEVPSD